MATAIILGWLSLLWYRASPPGDLRTFDQPVYLSIAYDMIHLGRFTDGSGWGTPHVDPARPAGMARTPLYPAFLAGTALLDPGFNQSLSCFVQRSDAPSCSRRAPLPRTLQFVMTVAVFLMLWRLATRATGSTRIGWFSLGLGLIAAPILVRSIDTLMTETVALFFTTAATAAAVEATKARRPFGWFLASGVMVGLAGMTRPTFAYLLPAAAIAACILIARCRYRLRGIAMVAAFLFGGGAVMMPWIARNFIIFGRPTLTSGYASSVLAQRVAFDLMSWHQYGLSYLCALPDGNGMGRILIGPGACEPFQYEMRSGTFYDLGNTNFMQSTITAAGGQEHQLTYLLHHYILADPIWHAMVSIPMAMRGLWIDHYWGMVLAILCMPLTLRSIKYGDGAILAVTLPGWFMLAFYAAVSANSTRYNLMLFIPFSAAGGIALDHLCGQGAFRRAFSKLSFLNKRSAMD
ncbi:MAG: glycosyltransferase family 39 protein [Acetobacteraceae bacterium]